MSSIRKIWNNWFGVNRGILKLTQRLQRGEKSIITYCRNDHALYEFRGSGKHVSGRGDQTEYQIMYRTLYFKQLYMSSKVSEWLPVTRDTTIFTELRYLDNGWFSDIGLPRSKHDIDTVATYLKSIASRLKPYQGYPIGSGLHMTNSFFTNEGYVFYDRNNFEVRVPKSMICEYEFISQVEILNKFDPELIKVMDQEKIDRVHRNDKDLKRWYILKPVTSSQVNHVIRFTHRNTGHAKVALYDFTIVIDSRAQASKPFYVTELLCKAIESLDRVHPMNEWHVELFVDNIHVKVYDHPEQTLDAYVVRQENYPENRDHNPIIINDNPGVRNTFCGYLGTVKWHIETLTERTRREQETTKKAGINRLTGQ